MEVGWGRGVQINIGTNCQFHNTHVNEDDALCIAPFHSILGHVTWSQDTTGLIIELQASTCMHSVELAVVPQEATVCSRIQDGSTRDPYQ